MNGLRSRLDGVLMGLRARRAARDARRRAAALPFGASADEVVDFVLSESEGGIEAWQIAEEFRSLARLVEARRPRTVLEIGTADGGTLFMHARLAAEDALVISIDLPFGPFGGGYPRWRTGLYRSFAGPRQQIELIRADSHAPATADRLEAILGGRRIDYAFIDGDHTFEGVRADFELCRRFAAPQAVIAFHDIAETPSPEWAVAGVTDGAVHAFWRQVKTGLAHDEFVADPHQQGFGIGVLHLDAEVGG